MPQFLVLMGEPPSLDVIRVSARLRALQQVAGNPAHGVMAARAGCDEGAWKMYYKGERPIPPECVAALKAHYPITSDWVFYGEARYNRQNDPAFQDKLDEAERNPIPMPRGRRKATSDGKPPKRPRGSGKKPPRRPANPAD